MLIGTFLLNWGGEYPETICDVGFETLCICQGKCVGLYRGLFLDASL